MAQIIVDLMPKYYITPRTLPITLPDGKRDYALINQQGGIVLKYRSEQLEVCISAGVNFSIQKSRALQQIIALMQASPLFAQFINKGTLSSSILRKIPQFLEILLIIP